MGFYIMILSFLLGIFFTILGVSRWKRNVLYKLFIVLGIILILFAVYLARPH
ncbi:exosortase [Jeotgalibacillus proteolyticus]|uniref:Exosortase n=1 Tax=Jeotgalibacillus proteolyticus TaxID=2082395 RepID=A0A2S5GDK4_9BACL|nr:exosortase [Jeotgalibacillus proteolyticus]